MSRRKLIHFEEIGAKDEYCKEGIFSTWDQASTFPRSAKIVDILQICAEKLDEWGF